MDAKYEQRKKMIYDFMCDDMYVPMKIKELAIVLGVKKDQRPQLEQILNELMTEGRIVCSKRGKFSKSEEKKITGTFQAHPKGFGFVSVEGEKEDIFISPNRHRKPIRSHLCLSCLSFLFCFSI